MDQDEPVYESLPAELDKDHRMVAAAADDDDDDDDDGLAGAGARHRKQQLLQQQAVAWSAEAQHHFVRDYVHELMPTSQLDVERSLESKLEGKMLMLEKNSKSVSLEVREERRSRRQWRNRHARPMSAAQRRKLGLFELDPAHARYELFEPLHTLWTEYMDGLLSDQAARDMQSEVVQGRVAKADWHGALVEVVRSTSASLVGTAGIVVQETQNCFKIVTKRDRFKTVPKEGSVFALDLRNQGVRVELFGKHLLFRSADRTSRKFKTRSTIEM